MLDSIAAGPEMVLLRISRAVDTRQPEAILTNYVFERATSESELQMRVGDLKARCLYEDGEWRFDEHLYTRAYTIALPLSEIPAAAVDGARQ